LAIIEKRGNSYSIRISTGYNTQGKQLKKNFTWKPNPNLTEKQQHKELQRQIIKYEDMAHTGRSIDGKIKFSEFADQWLSDYAEKQLAPKTINTYKHLLLRINAGIGHIRLLVTERAVFVTAPGLSLLRSVTHKYLCRAVAWYAFGLW